MDTRYGSEQPRHTRTIKLAPGPALSLPVAVGVREFSARRVRICATIRQTRVPQRAKRGSPGAIHLAAVRALLGKPKAAASQAGTHWLRACRRLLGS